MKRLRIMRNGGYILNHVAHKFERLANRYKKRGITASVEYYSFNADPSCRTKDKES